MPSLLETIKKAAQDAMNASEPSTFLYGTVTSANPLKIQVDSDKKLTLTKDFLVVGKSLQDREVEMEFDMETDRDEYGRTYAIKGKKTIKINNGLKAGDKVILLKQHGGQKYMVTERM